MKNINDDTSKLLGFNRITLYKIMCIGVLFETLVGGVVLIMSTRDVFFTINCFFIYYLLISIIVNMFETAYNNSDIKGIKNAMIYFAIVCLVNIGCFVVYYINIDIQYNIWIWLAIVIRVYGILNNLIAMIIIFSYSSGEYNEVREIERQFNNDEEVLA